MSSSFRTYLKSGEPFVWISAGALGLCLLLLAGLLLLIAINGSTGFWPRPVYQFELLDGTRVLGEISEVDSVVKRIKVKQGNRDFYGLDFRWLDQHEIKSQSQPADTVLIERYEWGSFYGNVLALESEEATIQLHEPGFQDTLLNKQKETRRILQKIKKLEDNEIRSVAVEQSAVLNKIRNLTNNTSADPDTRTRLEQQRAELNQAFEEIEVLRLGLQKQLDSNLVVANIDATEKKIPLDMVGSITYPNRLTLSGKLSLYAARIWNFISEEPREANTEGGVFPAIFGTVMMVIIMSIVVTPLGVLAAVYLHEYAKPGPIVTLVRIAVNNLAGVPSIVFGVFGVGFFIYGIGGTLDALFFADSLPTPTFGTGGILWASLTLALLTVPTVIVATEEGLASLPRHWREASFALGATRYETMRHVIIPALSPAILTGVILATARAAGEVAPLMITGVVKMAPTLPLDGTFPFFHMDRKFMHLGFHIYDLGFQSPNVDAARPMVYATTLLLLLIVIGLNSIAIIVRNRLSKKIHVGTI